MPSLVFHNLLLFIYNPPSRLSHHWIKRRQLSITETMQRLLLRYDDKCRRKRAWERHFSTTMILTAFMHYPTSTKNLCNKAFCTPHSNMWLKLVRERDRQRQTKRECVSVCVLVCVGVVLWCSFWRYIIGTMICYIPGFTRYWSWGEIKRGSQLQNSCHSLIRHLQSTTVRVILGTFRTGSIDCCSE